MSGGVGRRAWGVGKTILLTTHPLTTSHAPRPTPLLATQEYPLQQFCIRKRVQPESQIVSRLAGCRLEQLEDTGGGDAIGQEPGRLPNEAGHGICRRDRRSAGLLTWRNAREQEAAQWRVPEPSASAYGRRVHGAASLH